MLRHSSPIVLGALALILTVSCKKVVKVGGSSDKSGGGSAAAMAGSGENTGAPDAESLALLEASAAEADETMAADDEMGGSGEEGGAEGGEEGGEEEIVEGESEDTGEGEEEIITDESGEQPLEQRFNFVKWARTRPKLESMYKFFDAGNTMMTVGDKGRFAIETNGTFGVSPNFDSGESAERKIAGKFWLKMFAFNTQLKNQEDETGLFIDVGFDALLDKINIEMWFRYVGVDIASRSIMSGFDQIITREKSIEASAIPLVKGSVSLGGEMGVRIEFGVRRDNALNIIYTPHAQLRAAASIFAGVVIVETGIVGSINLVDLRMKGAANLLYLKGQKLLTFDLGQDPGMLKLIEGKLQFVPVKTAGIELAPRITIYKPDAFQALPTPGHTTSFIKFLTEPANSSACQTSSNAAANSLADGIKKAKVYLSQAPDEDKVMMARGIGRAGLVYRQIKEYCK